MGWGDEAGPAGPGLKRVGDELGGGWVRASPLRRRRRRRQQRRRRGLPWAGGGPQPRPPLLRTPAGWRPGPGGATPAEARRRAAEASLPNSSSSVLDPRTSPLPHPLLRLGPRRCSDHYDHEIRSVQGGRAPAGGNPGAATGLRAAAALGGPEDEPGAAEAHFLPGTVFKEPGPRWPPPKAGSPAPSPAGCGGKGRGLLLLAGRPPGSRKRAGAAWCPCPVHPRPPNKLALGSPAAAGAGCSP